ncbi:MAG: PQQ-dependent sugar dehydrogenase [Flavobacteriales bacterium]|nr:PQQ-dependent sugar dehydrogenase [Flavobacteriales bacterium]
MKRIIGTLLISSYSLFCAAQPQIELLELASGFTKPVDIRNAGDDRLFIVEKNGIIKIVDTLGTVNATPFMDITSIVTSGNSWWDERGLLGLAFHPNYAVNGYFFVNYIDGNGDTQISRFTVSAGDPDIGDDTSEEYVLNIAQPDQYHNGGGLQFGPDGFLYIGTGDGDGTTGGDPYGYGQDSLHLLGAMLRLDVDVMPYTIPNSNPFVGNPEGLDEIWATGLRNPWRYSFDSETGDLWIADVGQNLYEEVNMQPASSAGGESYGWNCYEGNSFYFGGDCAPDVAVYTSPVYDYLHTGDFCSITGGYMYRGSKYPEMYGHYVYTDYCYGEIMSLSFDGSEWVSMNHGHHSDGNLVSFGEDASGELYISGISDGKIYKVVELTVGIESDEPDKDESFYPNPVHESTTISFNNPNRASHNFVLSTLNGKEVMRETGIKTSTYTLDCSNMASAMYFYTLYSKGKQVAVGKLVVE